MPTEQEAKPAVVTPSLQQWRSPSTFRGAPEEVQSNALPTRLSGLVANYACGNIHIRDCKFCNNAVI
ncbi:hypothetical protein TNCV_4259771 [Trichonephila clavipes]|nr:hypothetical protein TNCV_4259771 [Trichonephila clavipes]